MPYGSFLDNSVCLCNDIFQNMHDKRDIKDRQRYKGDEAYKMKPIACPFCRKPGIIIGINFRVPKKKDVKSWKLLEKLLTKSYEELKTMKSEKNKRFVYLYYLKNQEHVLIHDYENRWMITNPNQEHYPRTRAILFGDDHCPKYYSYPTNLKDYPEFLREIKDGRKYFLSAKERWRIVRLYLKSISIMKYWSIYASNKQIIRNVLHIDPRRNIVSHFDAFQVIVNELKHVMPKDILHLICQYLFF